MIFTAEQIEAIRYGMGATTEGAEQDMQEVANMIADFIESKISSDDLIDGEPVAIAFRQLVDEIRKT